MRQSVRSNWQGVLLVCGKCSKEIDGGFGPKGRTPLAKALAAETGAGRKRKSASGVVEVKCLGLCPKRGVVVVDGARPDRWHIVPAGTPIDQVMDTLNLNREPRSPDPFVPAVAVDQA